MTTFEENIITRETTCNKKQVSVNMTACSYCQTATRGNGICRCWDVVVGTAASGTVVVVGPAGAVEGLGGAVVVGFVGVAAGLGGVVAGFDSVVAGLGGAEAPDSAVGWIAAEVGTQ